MDINKFNEMWVSIFEKNTNISDEEFQSLIQCLSSFQIIDEVENLLESESQKEILEHQFKKKSLRLFKAYIGGVLNVN